MKYLWTEWPKLKSKFLSDRTKLLFIDFDGTLVAIADTPDAVKLEPETKKTLKDLCATPGIRVVIVSGRPMKELSSYLQLKKAVLAANHGLEMKGRGVQLPPRAKQARRLRHFIGVMAQKFRMAFSCYPGVLVEDKLFTLSVHFRKLPPEQLPVFMEFVRFFRQKYHHYPVVWTQGKKVIEIRPSVYWGKADTVLHVIQKFPDALPVAIGDDQADEDMFKIVKKYKGVSIRAGFRKASAADYFLTSPYDVRVFLKKLCR